MKDNTNNKEFWNNYVTYWENKVEDANHNNQALDKTPDDLMLEELFSVMDVKREDKVLDYGCGFCRLYPIYQKILGGGCREEGYLYYGLDISKVMLEHAEIRYSSLKINRNLFEFDGLHIPFEDNSFDKIVCFAVFDAVNQEVVLEELIRVLKVGGKLLLSGKNDTYFSDDDDAYIAEVNARKKEHPNSFTDVHKLKKELLLRNILFEEERYFLYRKEFALNKYEKVMPGIFYQWVWIVKKSEEMENSEFSKFSDTFSKVVLKE